MTPLGEDAESQQPKQRELQWRRQCGKRELGREGGQCGRGSRVKGRSAWNEIKIELRFKIESNEKALKGLKQEENDQMCWYSYHVERVLSSIK